MSIRKSLSKKIRFEVFKRDSFTCQYCGKVAPNVVLELDHIEPVSKGGTNDILNLITSCYDCNRGKSDRELNDDSVVTKQRQQLELLQERREQIQQMFEWRKALQQISDDTNDMVISYIEDHIAHFSLNESGTKKISALTKTYDLADILESIDISAKKYLRYDSDGKITQDSAEEFLSKIVGILVNKNKPELDKKASYIKGICRNKFSYWNPQTGSIILNNYIKALRDHGWSDNRILIDLENEVQPKTIECKNWSQWRNFLEKWTEDIQGWDDREDEGETTITDEDLSETVSELFRERSNVIPALEYIGKPFRDFNSEDLGKKIDTLIINYLADLQEYFTEQQDREGRPRFSRSAKEILSMYTPVDSYLTYWLDNAIRGVVKQLLEPIDFYIEENPSEYNFRKLAEMYVDISHDEMA
jgi:Restriction endonuclease